MSLDTGYVVGPAPEAVITGDLNGDRKADIIVSNFASNKISIFYQQSDGKLSSKKDLVTGVNPSGIAIADIDGDGFMDILVSNTGSSSFSVFRNVGSGNFVRSDYGSGNAPRALAVADFDNDGDLDIATANSADNTVSVAINGTLGLSSIMMPGWNLLSIPLNTENLFGKIIYSHSTSAYLWISRYL